MKALNRSNISFFIAVIVLSVMMIFCISHCTQLFSSDSMSTAEHLSRAVPFPLMPMEVVKSSNPFIYVVTIFTSLFFMVTFFFSEDKKLRIFLWFLVSAGIVIMSVALITISRIF